MNIFISAGDNSADKHASNLAKEIKLINPDVRITSFGGKNLKESSDEFLFELTSLSAFGFFKPFKLYFKLKKLLKLTVNNNWNKNKPDKVILLDYYGFNIHVAEQAHKLNIPVYYFISPQVWASREGRIDKLKKYIKKMIVILPFEEEIYKKHGVDAVYAGNPLIAELSGADVPLKSDSNKIIIGLFPGSRENVYSKHLCLLENTAKLIKKSINAEFKLFAYDLNNPVFRSSEWKVVDGSDLNQRKSISFAVSVSGTVCLENAILGIPMIVFYRLSKFNYLVAKTLVKIKHIAMPNILSKKEIVPELIQENATPENIAENAIRLLNDKKCYNEMKENLSNIKKILGAENAIKKAAEIIMGKK